MTKRNPLTPEDVISARKIMRQSVLFCDLGPDQLDELLHHTSLVQLTENSVLFEQERPAQEFFMLVSGQIKLSRTSRDGQEKVIDLIHPGGSFAEAIMFSGNPVYPVTAMALCHSEVLCFDAACYTSILHQSNDACFAVMAQMSRRLHWQLMEIDRLTLHNATYRVIAYLLDQIPSTELGSSVIKLNTLKHVIASRLSITPETLSRTLSRLNRDNLIDINDDGILLRDVGQLRRYTLGE